MAAGKRTKRATRRQPRYQIGDQAVSIYGVHPPTQPYIPAWSIVSICDTSVIRYGRGRDWSVRYKVQRGDVCLWTDESELTDAPEGGLP